MLRLSPAALWTAERGPGQARLERAGGAHKEFDAVVIRFGNRSGEETALGEIQVCRYQALDGLKWIFGATSAKKLEIEDLVRLLESQNTNPDPISNLDKAVLLSVGLELSYLNNFILTLLMSTSWLRVLGPIRENQKNLSPVQYRCPRVLDIINCPKQMNSQLDLNQLMAFFPPSFPPLGSPFYLPLFASPR
ncbi:hypothetical protein MLD38_021429 [Melastoma candidum]|uniref:Uncharacterized protein n=1 Tax=Melastoma candidum TaxID=119954 RepID=A0ACB9QGB1_9MYRT|nr:hypothetical protein MLD38_021429 [Melastoma candidum]